MQKDVKSVFNFQLDAWLLLGALGVACLALRWLAQIYASHREKRSTVSPLFWLLSLIGSVSLLAYFTVGRGDLIGFATYLFATGVAIYNVILTMRNASAGMARPPEQTEAGVDQSNSAHSVRSSS